MKSLETSLKEHVFYDDVPLLEFRRLPKDIGNYSIEDDSIEVDGKTFIFSRDDRKFYDLNTGKVVKFHSPVWPKIYSLEDKLLIQSQSNKIFYDFKTGSTVFRFPRPILDVYKLGDMVLGRSKDGKTFSRFYDLKTGSKIDLPQRIENYSIEINEESIDCTVQIVEGKPIVQGIDKQTFYELPSCKVVRKFPTKVSRIMEDAKGRYLVKSSSDSKGESEKQIFYDFLTGTPQVSVPAHVHNIIYQVGKKSLLKVLGKLEFYDLETGKKAFKLPRDFDIEDTPHYVKKHTLVESLDSEDWYDLSTGKLAFNIPNGAFLFYVGTEPMLMDVDWRTIYELPSGKLHMRYPQRVSFCSKHRTFRNKIDKIENKYLVQGEDNKTFYDLKTGRILFRLRESVRSRIYMIDNKMIFRGEDKYKEHIFYEANFGAAKKVVECPLNKLEKLIKGPIQ